MATEEKIVYSVEVKSDKAGKSLSDLKKEFKDGQKELANLTQGTKEYVKQLEKLGGIKDDIGDLNQTIKAFNPEGKIQAIGKVAGGLASGFAAAQGAAALFGTENKDLEKTLVKVQAAMAFSQGIQGLASLGDGFKVLGAIIKSNPLFMIVAAVAAIGTALFALKDKIGFVGDAFDAIGKVIGYVTDKIKEFTDWIGISSFAMDKMTDSIIENNEKIKASTAQRYDSEIAALKRAGKETELAEIRKLNAFTKANDAIIAQLDVKDEEDRKRIAELRTENQKYYQDILNLHDTYHDRARDKESKTTEFYNQENQKRLENERKHREQIQALWDEATLARQEAEILAKSQKQEQDTADDIKELEDYTSTEEDKVNISYDMSALHHDIDQEQANNTFAIAQASNDGLQSLSDLYFMVKTRNLKKGSAEELKAAKQQFKINKALAITSATIQGVQAVLAAYSSGSAIPVVGAVTGPLFAALAGVTVAANIAKIASAKFNEGGGGGGGASVPAPSAPNIAPPTQGSTQLNTDGTIKQQPSKSDNVIKAVVVETDVTKTQKRVGSIETNAKL
jgi:hypothetical protein